MLILHTFTFLLGLILVISTLISAFFRVEHVQNPIFPDTPINISQHEFMAACQELAEAGVPIKADLEQAWQDFGG